MDYDIKLVINWPKLNMENFSYRGLTVGKSKINGFGLFADRDYKKDEVLFIVKGKERRAKFTKSETKTFPNDIAINYEKWITPFPNNPWIFVNHSCDPNIGIRGRVTVIASRYIKKGEELSIDYSMVETNPYWSIKCSCRSPKCRHKIVSFTKLDKKLKKKYYEYLPAFLKKNISEELLLKK